MCSSDLLITALGSQWPDASFAGLASPAIGVLSALAHPEQLGKRVVVVGAEKRGAEAAWYLALSGHTVTLIDSASGFGEDVNIVDRIVIPRALQSLGVDVHFGCEWVGASGDAAMLRAGNSVLQVGFDSVVNAQGAKPPDTGVIATWHACASLGFNIGESAGATGVIGATHSGHRMACRIE